MSQLETLRQLDADIADAMLDAGFADEATFTRRNATPIACRVLVTRGSQEVGAGQSFALSPAISLTAFLADIGSAPVKGDRFDVDGARFLVDRVELVDESRVICTVVPA